MKFLEKLYIKLLGNTKSMSFNMCDWDILTLSEKTEKGIPLTPAELYAKIFLEQMGEYIELWNPTKKWTRPYGKVLNETRTLH